MKETERKRILRLLRIGIAGAVLTMIGDCLLLGTDSSGAKDMLDSFIIIASKISYLRIGLAGSFGFAGIPLSAVGYYALYLLLSETDRKSRLGRLYKGSVIGGYAAMGGAIHIIACSNMSLGAVIIFICWMIVITKYHAEKKADEHS